MKNIVESIGAAFDRLEAAHARLPVVAPPTPIVPSTIAAVPPFPVAPAAMSNLASAIANVAAAPPRRRFTPAESPRPAVPSGLRERMKKLIAADPKLKGRAGGYGDLVKRFTR